MRAITRAPRVVVGVVAVLGFAAAPARAASLIVDDNRAECPSAPYTSIQAAVDAASTGDVVAVCPGTYVEGDGGMRGLVITKSLTIRGTSADEVFVQPNGGPDNSIFGPGGNAAGPPLRDTVGNIVSVSGADVDITGLTVRANDVAVETGIAYLNASGVISNVRVTGLVQSTASGGPGRFGVFERGQGIVAFSTVATGTFPITIRDTEVTGYNKGGILLDSLRPDLTTRSGSRVAGAIVRSRVDGIGPVFQDAPAQIGVQASFGASVTITGSTIMNNVFVSNPASGVGVLMVDADTADSAVNRNNIENNSFGLSNVDATGAADPVRAGVVDARNNWWGNENGPGRNVTQQDRGNPVFAETATFVPFAAEPFPEAAGAEAPVDLAPTVRLTAPANGATTPPGTPVAVSAVASDDVAVDRVLFRAGTTVIGVDSTPPYTATFTPSAAQAGTSQVITATAFDTARQQAESAATVRVVAPGAPTVDAAPRVAFNALRANAVLRGGRTTTLSVTATDDRGVAFVTFLAGGRVLCTDHSAPYTCAYRPGVNDVGRRALSAIVTDSTGQTAAALLPVRVDRLRPARLIARTTPTRDRKAPWRFRTSGRLVLPSGVSRAQACGAGVVAVQIKRGSATISTRRVTLRRDCGYASTVRFANRRRLGRTGRLRVTVRFLGNARLAGVVAPARRVRAG